MVQGWVATNEWIFKKHSVVTDIQGGLLCGTPQQEGSFIGPFIVHQEKWDKEAFSRLPAQVMVPMDVPT